MNETIQTVFHSYHFDVSMEPGRTEYTALAKKLKAAGLRKFHSCGGGSHCKPEVDGVGIDLETSHLFSNQWNTGPIEGVSDTGLRVFDWAEDACLPNKDIRCGHYLDQTPEMVEVRRKTNGCGYCGHQRPAAKGDVFCPDCLGNEYLKSSEIHLLRMRAIDEDTPRNSREPLTERESARLLPLYRDAQRLGVTSLDKARLKKQRESLHSDAEKAIANAMRERDGMLWLMDHGLKTDNVIYYGHTELFCFGWRADGVDPEALDGILEEIGEFPFAYEIKTAGGDRLAGGVPA